LFPRDCKRQFPCMGVRFFDHLHFSKIAFCLFLHFKITNPHP
jgi:hypothetical protein